jgi:myo-inositol-1(or 4)-monophosphatase
MSSTFSPEDDLSVAYALADAAAAHSLRLFRTPLDIIAKPTFPSRRPTAPPRQQCATSSGGSARRWHLRRRARARAPEAERVWVLDPDRRHAQLHHRLVAPGAR